MTEPTPAIRATGRCLCGAVKYAIRGPLRTEAVACHCTSCRRCSGGIWIGSVARREHVVFERGFCGQCGSSLFWEGDGEPAWSIAAGSLDEPTGLKLAVHSWTAESADWWSFDPGIPRMPGPSGLTRG